MHVLFQDIDARQNTEEIQQCSFLFNFSDTDKREILGDGKLNPLSVKTHTHTRTYVRTKL
jgi:hypothetical protein